MNREKTLQALLNLLADACGEQCILQHPEIDLLETGLLDSLGMIELLEGIEDAFGVTLEPTRIEREQWRNAESILRLIEQSSLIPIAGLHRPPGRADSCENR